MGFWQCERESLIGVAKNGPAEKHILACEVKIHWVFNISMFFGQFLSHFGVQDGIQKSTLLKVVFLIDLDRFLASWNGLLGPKLASWIFWYFFGGLKNRTLKLEKSYEGQFWPFFGVQNRCQERPWQKCKNAVFASVKHTFWRSGGGPGATKKNLRGPEPPSTAKKKHRKNGPKMNS